MTKSLLIAGTHSGCGKTSFTLGLLAACARRGMACAPFKTGPDFIDPGLHALACGRTSHNLDSWMLPPEANRDIFARNAHGADLALVEGAMGLFDGSSGAGGPGSAAHMAKLLDLPVVLVVDASGMAGSIAALAQGFARFDPELRLAGVVANRTGGPNHRRILAQALDAAGVRLLGCLPKDPELSLPPRHLGLTTAEECGDCADWLARLAVWVESHLDLAGLVALLPEKNMRSIVPEALPDAGPQNAPRGPGRAVRLGVARDKAFCFLYAENIRLLAQAGAEPVFFSPLADSALPPDLDGLYLPGGYPELHAPTLAANTGMLAGLGRFCASGRPVLAECGGFMALMDAIEDQSGRVWPMAGVFSCRARMGRRFAALGYRQAILRAPCPLGPAGTTARGHEFHYSSLVEAPRTPWVYGLSGSAGTLDYPEGFLAGNTLGSYVHLHFASNPDLARSFVAAMREPR